MQDSAALANTDYVQLERLFQQLLKAKNAEAVTDNCLATNSCSSVSCSAAVRDVALTKRPSDPTVVAAAAAEKAAAEAKRVDKPKASSAPDKPSQSTGGLPAGIWMSRIAFVCQASCYWGQPVKPGSVCMLCYRCARASVDAGYVPLRQGQ